MTSSDWSCETLTASAQLTEKMKDQAHEKTAVWVKSLTLQPVKCPEEDPYLHAFVTFALSFPNLQALTIRNQNFCIWYPALNGFACAPPPTSPFKCLKVIEFQNCYIHLDAILAFLLPYAPTVRTFRQFGHGPASATAALHPLRRPDKYPEAELEWRSRATQAASALASLTSLDFGSTWQGDSLVKHMKHEPAWFVRIGLLQTLDWTICRASNAKTCAQILDSCRGTLKDVSILARSTCQSVCSGWKVDERCTEPECWAPELDFRSLNLTSLNLCIDALDRAALQKSLCSLDSAEVESLRIEFRLVGRLDNVATQGFLAWMRADFTEWVRDSLRSGGVIHSMEVVFTSAMGLLDGRSDQTVLIESLARSSMARIGAGLKMSSSTQDCTWTILEKVMQVQVNVCSFD